MQDKADTPYTYHTTYFINDSSTFPSGRDLLCP